MKSFFRIFFLLFTLGVWSSSGFSQDSLLYYLKLSELNNPGVRSRLLEYSASLEKVPQASSLPDPEIQLGFFVKPMELLSGNQISDIRFMQMFPWFGTLKAAKDEAFKMAITKLESYRNARNELHYQVKASYYRIYRTMKEVETAEKNLKILQTLEQLALIKYRSGGTGSAGSAGSSMSSGKNMLPIPTSPMNTNSMTGQNGMGTETMSSSNSPTSISNTGSMIGTAGNSMNSNDQSNMVDLLRVQMEIRALENRIAFLKDQLLTDKADFNRFLNRPPLSEVYIVDSLSETPIPREISFLADSLGNHPMVKMYIAESEASSAKSRMADRMGYPMIGLGMNYSVIQKRAGSNSMMNGKDMIMPMVSLTLPVYRKKYKAMRNEAELMKEAAMASAENTQNDLRVSFQQAVQNLYDADRRIKLYANQAMLADKSLNLLIASYSARIVDFEEVLRMQQQLLNYQLNQIEAVVDKMTFVAQITYLTGN